MPASKSTQNRRSFLKTGSAAALGAGLLRTPPATPYGAPPPRVQRLSWAGLKVETDETTLLIDPVVTDVWDGHGAFPMITPEVTTARRYVLVTHLHGDHYDRAAVTAALGDQGRVVCHADIAEEVASDGFRVRPAALFEPVRLGGFVVMAVPAVDGLGVKGGQVSWVVRGGGRTLFHGGDTLWHGHWWLFRQHFGPVDAAYLPVNGFRLVGMDPPSDVAMSMTPEQAATAAMLLGARTVTPIHYGVHNPDYYVEYPDAADVFAESARRHGLQVALLAPGEWA